MFGFLKKLRKILKRTKTPSDDLLLERTLSVPLMLAIFLIFRVSSPHQKGSTRTANNDGR